MIILLLFVDEFINYLVVHVADALDPKLDTDLLNVRDEMLAILTRLGKGGKIIINGDNDQSDIRDQHTGLKICY